MRVVHKKTDFVLGEDVRYANSFRERLLGLMFSKEMIGDGLLLEPCTSIHNCFVRFPIDVIFMDRDNKVVKVLRHFKQWRFSWIYLGARRALELPAGKVPDEISKGDQLEVMGV